MDMPRRRNSLILVEDTSLWMVCRTTKILSRQAVRPSSASSTSDPARSIMKAPKRPSMISNYNEIRESPYAAEHRTYILKRPHPRLGHSLYKIRSGKQNDPNMMLDT